MLKQLIILNSKNYGKASIKLDDCDSLQLVGPNNVGKSTLIYALNFLFIIDGKKMTFSGNKSGDKETVHHYFPSATNSYIIFEIFKERYYCIVLKRNNDSEIEYYQFDSEYKEKFFLQNQENGQQKVLKFDDFKINISTSGLTLNAFKNKSEVFNFVYQRGKRNKAVVWLENSVVSDGLSNNFSKIYRYLINSKLITNKTLKDALIIADNKDKEKIGFSHKSRKDINDMLRINDDIKAIGKIQKDFSDFKETVNLYNGTTKLLANLIYAFNQKYQSTLIEVKTQLIKKKEEAYGIKIELDENLNPAKQKFDRDIGGKDKELEYIKKENGKIQQQIDEINSFDDLPLLQQTLSNVDNQRKKIESSITRIESQKLSSKEIKQKIEDLTIGIERHNRQIKGYANQLIHNITDKQTDKEILNFILSDDISSLSKKLINKKISQLGGSMHLFDGEIKLPSDIGRRKIESIEALKEKLEASKKEKEEFEKLLPIAVGFEKAQKELQDIKTQIDEIKTKIRKTNEKPTLEKKLSINQKASKKSLEEKKGLEKKLKILQEEIIQKSSAIDVLTEAKKKLETWRDELKRWKGEIEYISIEPTAYETDKELKQIHSKITSCNKNQEKLHGEKTLKFEQLKNTLKSTEADPALFIQFVEEEIACLPNKEESIDKLLQAISTQFSNPAHTLVSRYREFKEFIYNKINRKLGTIRISDIESLRIELVDNRGVLDELKKISSIEELKSQMSMDFDRSENLKALNRYLDAGKEIAFEDLFDIELQLTKDGKSQKRDLKNQVESDGTDKMIRLVIIMLIINRLAINDKENKIAIFIDEIASIDGNNRPELFKFCNEHNFIPICASTEETMLDGFDKHYLLLRPAKGKQVNINEQQNAIRPKVLAEHEAN